MHLLKQSLRIYDLPCKKEVAALAFSCHVSLKYTIRSLLRSCLSNLRQPWYVLLINQD